MSDNGVLLAAIRTALEAAFGPRLRQVVLFGSFVRGGVQSESDVDVLVVLDEVPLYARELRRAIEAVYPLSVEMGRRFSVKPVAEARLRGADAPLFATIAREGVRA